MPSVDRCATMLFLIMHYSETQNKSLRQIQAAGPELISLCCLQMQ